MIVTAFAYPKADGNKIEKERFSQVGMDLAQIISGMENQLILPNLELILWQDGAVRATIIIGDHAGEMAQLAVFKPHQIDMQACGRLAKSRIQNMGGEKSAHSLFSILSSSGRL